MKLPIKIVLTIIVTLLLLIYLAGFLPVFSQAPTDWVITGRVMAPSPETTENIAITNAIITLTDIQGDIHIVSTGEDGYYFFKNLAVDAKCVITAIAIVNGKTMVFKDVIPWPVAAHETYDAGTADAESTALALIVEELIEQGLTYEDIDLEIIQESENFEIVEEHVFSVLEDNGNIMDDIVVAGEEVESGETPESTEVDAPDIEATDEEGKLYKVTVTLREKISDDDPSADPATPTSRDTYTINASFVGSGVIEPSGAVSVNNGSSQTFTITPDANCHILGITIDGVLDVGPFVSPYTYTFDNVTDEHTIEAYLAIDNYAIAVIVGNNGSISPSGAVTVNHGSNQTFTITPDLNYHIDDVLVEGISVGAISSYAFDNVTEDGHTISATFAIYTYTLNMTTDADGTGSGTVSPAEGVHIYDYGDVVIISATADPSSTFTGWSGDTDSENSDVTLTMTENKDITASFTLNTYTLTVNRGGNGAGTVTIDPVQESYDHGDVVTISTTADAISSDFTGWTGDDSDDLIENDDGTYSITMDSNKSVIPTFNLKKVTLTVDVAGTGSGTVNPTVGVHTYNYGELVTIGAKPDTGYFGTWIATEDMIGSIFTGWSGDASGTSDLILTMDSDKSVIANFAKKRIVTLTVVATGSGSGTVIPPVGIYTYNYGDVVTIGATPDTASGTWVSDKEDLGSIFTGWNGDASGTSDLSLIMDSDKLITATFTLEKVKLTMAVTGTGSGTVSPTEGVHTYDYGETITIKATADPGSVFTGWSGDASGTGDLSLTMDSDKLITATFTLEKVKLTMAVTGTGSGTVSPTEGVHTYDYGETITIKATADPGSVFTGWSGDASGTSDLSLIMDSDKLITATFTLEKVKLTMAVTGTGSGTVSPTEGVHTYDYGETITIKATADPGSDFDGWSGDASGTGDVTLTMDSNKSVTAPFTLKTYTITASAGSNGSISPSGGVTVNHGSDQSLTITPTTGYHIADVLVDGNSEGAVASYTFTNVTTNHTIEATFAINTYTIAASAGSGGSISPSGGVSVNYNADQSFTITPEANYQIADVVVDGSSVGAVASYTFTNVTTNHTIEATFAINTYTIAASAGSNGSISPSGDVSVNYNANQSFTITPEANYQIADVVVDGSSVGVVSSYTFSNVTANHTIAATFATSTYDLTMAVSPEGGSVSGAGTYDAETTVDISATADTNYVFVNWTGDVATVADVNSASTTIFMNSGKTVTANFVWAVCDDGYDISYYHNQTDDGTTFEYTFWENWDGTDNLSGCSDISYVQLDFGDASWNDNVFMEVNHPPYTKVVVDDMIKMDGLENAFKTGTITITFTGSVGEEETGVLTIKAGSTGTGEFYFNVNKPKKTDLIYTITATAGSKGTISPEGEVTVEHGSSQTFTITPDDKYQISDVLVDDSSIGKVSTYTFDNVTDNHDIVVSFERK